MQASNNVLLFSKGQQHIKLKYSNTNRGMGHSLIKQIGAIEMPRQSAVRVIKSHVKGRATRRSNPEARDDRNEKFRKLAVKRVPRALHTLRLIENLASHNYKYTPEQADKIIRALEDGLDKVKEAFNKPKPVRQTPTFDI
jgi:hypothetical protein